MSNCNPYTSTCGLTGTEIWSNPYQPDHLLWSEYIVVNFDTGEREVVKVDEFEFNYPPRLDDELPYFYYMGVTEPEANPIPEPPLVALIVLAYLVYWLLRRS